MNILVLCGGLSTERDVSFKSGTMVAKALRENGHKVLTLDVFMGYKDEECDISNIFEISEEASVDTANISEIAPDLEKVKASSKDQSDCFFGPNVIAICRKADIVFMALHGENGENGKVQAAFDLFGIKYTGTDYLSSAIAMNKNIAKEFMIRHNIPCPTGIRISKSDNLDEKLLAQVKYPCVVKPACGGSSIGVSIAENQDEFKTALADAFMWEEEVVVEDYIEGREFSVGVMEGKALPVIEIAPIEGFYDYKNKYKAGSAIETCPADIPDNIAKEMQHYAEEAMTAIGLTTYARMDFMLRENGEMFCLEANTLPGMTPTSLLPQEANAIGINFNELCEKIIEISLKKYQ